MSSSTPTTEVDIRDADWQRDGEQLRQVRRRVFIEEQSVPEEMEWDTEDQQAAHLLATDRDGRPVGTVRILSSGRIGRLAVLAHRRGQGIGAALLRRALAVNSVRRWPAPFLSAQTSALPFYVRMGFIATGEEFMEAGIPHRDMVLDKAGGLDPAAKPEPADDSASGLVKLDGREAIHAIALQLAGQAQHGLRLFSQDLDAELYDNEAFMRAIRQVALRGREIPVRILLADAEPAIRNGHRIIEAARLLTSMIQIRRVPEELNRRREAYLLADDRGYLLRRRPDVFEATADFNAPGSVRRLGEEFDNAWSRGEVHQELRRLYL